MLKVFCVFNIYGRTPKMGLSFGGWDPCSKGFPCWESVLGTYLYQCSNWCCCERLCSTSANFFGRLFQWVCPFHDAWFTSTSVHTALSVQQFWPKKECPPHATPYSLDLTLLTFFGFTGWKMPSKRNIVLMWKRWNKKQQKH